MYEMSYEEARRERIRAEARRRQEVRAQGDRLLYLSWIQVGVRRLFEAKIDGRIQLDERFCHQLEELRDQTIGEWMRLATERAEVWQHYVTLIDPVLPRADLTPEELVHLSSNIRYAYDREQVRRREEEQSRQTTQQAVLRRINPETDPWAQYKNHREPWVEQKNDRDGPRR